MRRVVITGIGLITPLAVGTRATWSALLEGRGAVGPVRGFDASSLRSRLAAEVDGFDGASFVPVARMRRTMTRNDQLAVAGATLALRDADLEVGADDGHRAGLFVGGNKEISQPAHLLDAAVAERRADGTVDVRSFCASAQRRVHPFFFVEGLQAASLFYISQVHGIKGANAYFAGVAEASATAVGRAFRAVRRGEVDVALAGGFDDAVTWWNFSKLDALGMMSPSHDRGAAACRPFDRDRDGTVLGEGSAFLLLEDLTAARRRGARIYAEVTGFGSAFDAEHVLTPAAGGEAVAQSMRSALGECGWDPRAVDYVAAHGSGTRLGDASESRALAGVFGAAGRRTSAGSIKPATGHLCAAAGTLNAAVAALAIAHGVIPPTLNLDAVDPECHVVDWVRGRAREQRVRRALAVSRGVEGHSVALALADVSAGERQPSHR